MTGLGRVPTESVQTEIKNKRGQLGQFNGRLATVGRPAARMLASKLSWKAPFGEPEAGTDLLRQVGQMRKHSPSPGCGHFGERGPESSRCGGGAPGLSG